MNKLLTTQEDLSASLNGQDLVLVPTMGALHQGHLSLMQIARKQGFKVIVSIFVNPLQFSQGEDFDKYPRDLNKDLVLIADLADYIWAPGIKDIFPTSPQNIKANPELANKLCGLSRPGHFDGVCTVVKTLFDIVKPKQAVFGEKDFQQLLIIEAMVKEYQIPVEIIRAPIIREASGLAMSSRNQYLSEQERKLAASLFKELNAVQLNQHSLKQAKLNLSKLGFEIDYLEEHWSRLFIAARLGRTRLIDNIRIQS